MSVNIHGKEYITVAERLIKAHSELKEISITTEVLYIEPRIVIRATVITNKGTFSGISAANVNKAIEKESPFEVAESSAVGRALAFAGYETTNGIASAEEMFKALNAEKTTTVDAKECTHEDHTTRQSKKEGPNKDKWYKACNKCKTNGYPTFIGWTDAPEEIVTNENGSKSWGKTEFSEPH